MPIRISDVSKTKDTADWISKEYEAIQFFDNKASAIKLARRYSSIRKDVIVTRNQERGWWGVYVKKT